METRVPETGVVLVGAVACVTGLLDWESLSLQ